MGKSLQFDEQARRAMERGVNILADTVKVTQLSQSLMVLQLSPTTV